jgi:predicted DNA-binding transcriptional regulator AlpA
MKVDRLLKPSDVVQCLGTSRSWVYEAAKRGDIPSIRLGSQDGPLRFVERDIETWINDARERWQPGKPTPATRRNASARQPTRAGRPATTGSMPQLKLEV